MHLRRALLLFALVLGMTAIAASIAPPPPPENRDETSQPAPQASPPGATREARARFRQPPGGRRPVRRVEPGVPLVVTVATDEPGQASIPLLGRVASLTPEDPARIDLLAPDSGSYDVEFTPFEGGEPRRLGRIVVRSQR